MPLAIDLFCGLGGWTDGLLAEGYDVIGFDIPLSQDEADDHVIRHVAEGRWPNAAGQMVRRAFARRLLRLSGERL